MAKVFTIPVRPNPKRKSRERAGDPRYVDGQRLLVNAIKYLTQSDVQEIGQPSSCSPSISGRVSG